MRTVLGLCLTAGAAVALVACGSSGEGGRKVDITQAEEGCTPTAIEATAGEKLDLVVKNDSGKDYEIEGIDGAKLEEVIVPESRTRSIGYNVPEEGGVTKLKCYIPGGVSTIIEVQAGAAAETSEGAGQQGSGSQAGLVVDEQADVVVPVVLREYAVEPEVASVAAGKIRFLANNAGQEVHELYVLKAKDNGFDVVGEIEHIAPGESGAMTLEVPAGEYRLACLIAAGESGSTVDHFKKGMSADFKVE